MAAITPDTISSAWTGFNMSGFQYVGSWILRIAIGLIILGVLWFVYYYLSFKIKVTYYPIQGDPNNKDTWVLSHPKKDRARIIKKKGINEFKLLWARKKIKEVPYEHLYPDGLYMVRLSSNEFQPIKRPQIYNPLGIVIEPVDTDMEMWKNLQYEDLRKRFTNDDAARKQMIMTAGIVIGLIVLTAFVLWMNISYNSSALEQTNSIVQALNNVGARIGIN